MSEEARIERVVWGVDAFDDPERLRKQAPEMLHALGLGSLVVQPVYVLSPGQVNLSAEFSGPWINEYRPSAQKALETSLAGIPIPGLLPPKVIVGNFSSSSQSAAALAGFAKSFGADLILVSTHARKGITRILLGSFAETLVYHSDIPVLVIGPSNRIPASVRHILLPTEFGFASRKVFRRVVCYARAFGAKVTLFHAITHRLEPILQSGAYLLGGSWVPVQAYFSDETDRHIRRAAAWARWAGHQGVHVDALVDARGDSVLDSVLYLSRTREVDLIVMEPKTGPIASTLIGSVTKQVIRHADCPVWVIRPELAKKSRSTADARHAA